MPAKALAGTTIVAMNLFVLFVATSSYNLAVNKGLLASTMNYPVMLGLWLSILFANIGCITGILKLSIVQTNHDIVLAAANSILQGGTITLAYFLFVSLTHT